MAHTEPAPRQIDLEPTPTPCLEPDLAGLRVLIAHDWITTWAGSERCVEQMLAVFPDADVIVGFRSQNMRGQNEVLRRAKETWLARLPGVRTKHRWFLPFQALAFASIDTSAYDIVVSSSHALSKALRAKAGAAHVCYCHSPPRYVWDLQATYKARATPLERVALSAGGGFIRWLDGRAAQGVDHFIANSRYVASRIRRVYGRTANVVYPPVTPKPFEPVRKNRGTFLLSLGRLVPYKRTDLAIAAAERLGTRLIVAGDGPERERLERQAGPHTEFVGQVSEQEAGRLMASCAAFVFCAEEDFGITPLEANAHGAPVVAFRAGGIRESQVQGHTAEFFDRQSVDAVAAAVERALSRTWNEEIIRKNALRFAPDRFRRGFRAEVGKAVGHRPKRDR